MRKEQIRESICEFVFEKSNHEERDDLKLDVSLLANGILDSFGIIELVEYIEERFQIQITDEEFGSENFGNINAMVEFVENKLSQKK